MSYPLGCDVPNSRVACIRGGNGVFEYFWKFTIMLFICDFFYVTITMFMVYRQVEKVESFLEKVRFKPRTNPRYPPPSSNADRQHKDKKKEKTMSKKIFRQGILYSLALFVINAFPISLFVTFTITNKIPAIFYVLIHIFQPLQGFFNALIYYMPKFLKWKASNALVKVPPLANDDENRAPLDDNSHNQVQQQNYERNYSSYNDNASEPMFSAQSELSNMDSLSYDNPMFSAQSELSDEELEDTEQPEGNNSDDDLDDFFCL